MFKSLQMSVNEALVGPECASGACASSCAPWEIQSDWLRTLFLGLVPFGPQFPYL